MQDFFIYRSINYSHENKNDIRETRELFFFLPQHTYILHQHCFLMYCEISSKAKRALTSGLTDLHLSPIHHAKQVQFSTLFLTLFCELFKKIYLFKFPMCIIGLCMQWINIFVKYISSLHLHIILILILPHFLRADVDAAEQEKTIYFLGTELIFYSI